MYRPFKIACKTTPNPPGTYLRALVPYIVGTWGGRVQYLGPGAEHPKQQCWDALTFKETDATVVVVAKGKYGKKDVVVVDSCSCWHWHLEGNHDPGDMATATTTTTDEPLLVLKRPSLLMVLGEGLCSGVTGW